MTTLSSGGFTFYTSTKIRQKQQNEKEIRYIGSNGQLFIIVILKKKINVSLIYVTLRMLELLGSLYLF